MLSETAIRNAKPRDRNYKLFDGDGLYIEVVPSGGKWWRFKYRYDGKEKRLSLGTYPDTSLKLAREKRNDSRQMQEWRQRSEGGNPRMYLPNAREKAAQNST